MKQKELHIRGIDADLEQAIQKERKKISRQSGHKITTNELLLGLLNEHFLNKSGNKIQGVSDRLDDLINVTKDKEKATDILIYYLLHGELPESEEQNNG